MPDFLLIGGEFMGEAFNLRIRGSPENAGFAVSVIPKLDVRNSALNALVFAGLLLTLDRCLNIQHLVRLENHARLGEITEHTAFHFLHVLRRWIVHPDH